MALGDFGRLMPFMVWIAGGDGEDQGLLFPILRAGRRRDRFSCF